MFAMGAAFFQGARATLALAGSFAAATVGAPYSSSLSITGGLAPYSLTGGTGVASGSLPAGLSLSISGSTLVLSGTPTTASSNPFVASVTSTDLQTATSSQSVTVASSAPYAAAVLALTPTAYYKFNDVSGAVAAATAGANGAYVGSPTLGVTSLMPGSSDKCVASSAVANYATVPTPSTFGNSDFTIAMVFKYASLGTPQILMDTTGGTTQRLFIAVDLDGSSGYAAGQLRIFTHDQFSGFGNILSGLGITTPGNSYLLIVGRASGTPFVTLNNVSALASGTMVTGAVGAVSQNISVLQTIQSTSFRASATVGHLALWLRALSSTECTSLQTASGL